MITATFSLAVVLVVVPVIVKLVRIIAFCVEDFIFGFGHRKIHPKLGLFPSEPRQLLKDYFCLITRMAGFANRGEGLELRIQKSFVFRLAQDPVLS